jgi:hypothetical protein
MVESCAARRTATQKFRWSALATVLPAASRIFAQSASPLAALQGYQPAMLLMPRLLPSKQRTLLLLLQLLLLLKQQ